jgi:hypothetical protein
LKIGVIFFGLPRNSYLCLPSIQRFVFEELAGHEVFIESCLSLQQTICNGRSNEVGVLEQSNYAFFQTHPHRFISPKDIFDDKLHSELMSHGDPWNDQGISLKNLLLQLALLKIGYLNCKKNNCDMYLFVRPDLLIIDRVPIATFISRHYGKKAMMVLSWQWWGGCNDRFALATRSAADAFGMRYDKLLDYCNKHDKPAHSERFLFEQLRSSKVRIVSCSTKMARVRTTGEVVNEDYSTTGVAMGGFIRATFAQFSLVHRFSALRGVLMVSWFQLVRLISKDSHGA